MLCPEVWNFTPPEHSFTFSAGNWKTSDGIKSIAKKYYFNHLVSVVLPDTLIVPQNLIELLSNECGYYRVPKFPLTALIANEFIEAFIKSGQFTALSIGTRVDCDNCIAVTPTGNLIFSLLKEAYEELGLEGKLSNFCRLKKRPTRYLVSIDLKTLNPKSKKYERIQVCLSRFQAKHIFDLILAWDPPIETEKVCPSPIADFFDKQGIQITSCTPKFTQRLAYNVKIPLVKWRSEDIGCSHIETLEWLGAFSVGADLDDKDDSGSIFSMEHTTTCGQTAYLQWKGFYTTQQIITFLENLQKYICARNFPWAAVHVAGYEDVPVVPGLREHRWYGAFGDNSYTLLFHPKGNYMASTLSASQKLLKH
ncbi:ribonuclease P protein subunit p40-like [Hetaerina americana]|uniref:ribonuclease P protein subunit p40-like n=1 Tax=Hetaerina americana TaxID=62018 RepID=UPI003A7F22B0